MFLWGPFGWRPCTILSYTTNIENFFSGQIFYFGRAALTPAGVESMQQFTISPEGYKKFRKKMLKVSIPLAFITLVFISVIIIFSTDRMDNSYGTLGMTLGALVVLYSVSLFIGFRRHKKVWLNYTLTIGENAIVREQLSVPDISINFMEVKEIVKKPGKYFIIKGAGKFDVIYVPIWIDNVEELERQLEGFAPVTPDGRVSLFAKFRVAGYVVRLLSLIGLFTLTNKVIVGICGVLATGLLVWAFYETQNSKNVSRGVKQRSWLVLLVIVFVVWTTYTKLVGGW